VIVNPISGGGKGLEDFPKISHLLREHGVEHDPAFTEHRYHATELAVEAVNKGYRKIIVVGGDGTLNETVNGLFIQKLCEPKEVLLAVIAVGTGNDWIRMFGIPRRYSEAIRAIKEGYTFLQDVAAVEYEESHYRQVRYMANVAGLGFDAAVIRRLQRNKLKRRLGAWAYIWTMIRTFFGYKSTGVKIWVDDKLIYNDLLFSMAIGVGKYNGGGVQQLPEAVADDGLLDITMIKPLHWWNILFRIRKMYNGTIYSIGHVLYAQGEKIRIESTPETPLEIDGELLGGTPVEFNVRHREVRVIVNKTFLKDKK
jgi:YegS/Rv2252/BmrU family lipid kinase